MISQQVIFQVLFKFVLFNCFVALILNYQRTARSKAEEIGKILKQREDKVIEVEIRNDIKKAEEKAKNQKF